MRGDASAGWRCLCVGLSIRHIHKHNKRIRPWYSIRSSSTPESEDHNNCFLSEDGLCDNRDITDIGALLVASRIMWGLDPSLTSPSEIPPTTALSLKPCAPRTHTCMPTNCVPVAFLLRLHRKARSCLMSLLQAGSPRFPLLRYAPLH